MPTPPYSPTTPGREAGPPVGSCYAQHRETRLVCGLTRGHDGRHSWERTLPTAETNGVSALLDEVQDAHAEVERDRASYGSHRIAVAYVLGRRGMPLSEAPRVRHLLSLRERGHAV